MQPPLPLPPLPLPASLLSHQSVRAEGWECVVDHCPDASYILKPPAIIYIMSLLPLLAALLLPPSPPLLPHHRTAIHTYVHVTHTPEVHTDALTDNRSHKQWHTMTCGGTKTDSLVTYAEKQRRAVCSHMHKHTHTNTHTHTWRDLNDLGLSSRLPSRHILYLFLCLSLTHPLNRSVSFSSSHFCLIFFSNPSLLPVMERYYTDRS